MNKILAITVYFLASVFFSLFSLFRMILCLITLNNTLAKSIAAQFDDTFNVASGGRPDVKFSSRIWVQSQLKPNSLFWTSMLFVVDGYFYIFEKEDNHCYNSYLNDKHKFNN